MAHTPCCGVSFWIYVLIIMGLVLFAGVMSGLTLGLMSLGLVDLEVLKRSGTPADRKHAEKILPVVKNQHLLLCTLLIGNALAMEALPIFLDSLVAAWGAILISVTLILMFGEAGGSMLSSSGLKERAGLVKFGHEIRSSGVARSCAYSAAHFCGVLVLVGVSSMIRVFFLNQFFDETNFAPVLHVGETQILPQAICTRYGLAVGAFMSPFVRVLVLVFFPVSYPISKLLDKILGKGHVALFRRAELKTLVDMHGNEAGKGGELTHDETTIIAGALELTEKTAVHAMTPISAVFAVDINAKLDMEMMNLIMGKGHSRIPVYSGNPSNIIGLILVKNLLAIRAQDEVPVRNLTIRKIPRVPESMPLYDILNEFQKGHSHMAAVVKYSKEKLDSMQRSKDGSKMDRRLSGRRHSRRTSDTKGASNYKFLALDIPEVDAPSSDTGSPQKKSLMTGSATPDHSSFTCNISKLTSVTLSNPPANGMETEAPEGGPPVGSKSRKREAPEVILDMSPESLLSFPNDEEVVGIITMEDLIEELLQEEILDETDEYIDVHNKIKVNLLPPGGRSPASPTSSSFPPTADPSLSHTPAPTSPQSSPIPRVPVSTPAWNSAPGSPLVSLACTEASHHHSHLKALLHDNNTEPSLKTGVDEGRPN